MEKFSSFITEQKDVPYELLIISHDGIDDVNETGPLIKSIGQKIGIKVFLSEFMGAYMEDDGKGKVFCTYGRQLFSKKYNSPSFPNI